MLRRYGHLLGPEEMRAPPRSDPGPSRRACCSAMSALEPPDAAEGFSAIEEVPFRRNRRIGSESRARRLARRRRVANRSGARANLTAGRRAPAGTRAAAAPRGRGFCSSADVAADLGDADGISKGRSRVLRRSEKARAVAADLVLPPRRRTARVLVPKAAARARRWLLVNQRLDAARSLFVGRSRLGGPSQAW